MRIRGRIDYLTNVNVSLSPFVMVKRCPARTQLQSRCC